jgi:hypothetical protein
VFHRSEPRLQLFEKALLAYGALGASLIFLVSVLARNGTIGTVTAAATAGAVLVATGLWIRLLTRNRGAIARSIGWPYTRMAEYIPLHFRVAYWAVAGAGAALGGLIA